MNKNHLGDVLRHYGVKGMKWDKEKKKNDDLMPEYAGKTTTDPAELTNYLFEKAKRKKAAEKAANRAAIKAAPALAKQKIGESYNSAKKATSSAYNEAKKNINNAYKETVPMGTRRDIKNAKKSVTKTVSNVIPKKQTPIQKKTNAVKKKASDLYKQTVPAENRKNASAKLNTASKKLSSAKKQASKSFSKGLNNASINIKAIKKRLRK